MGKPKSKHGERFVKVKAIIKTWTEVESILEYDTYYEQFIIPEHKVGDEVTCSFSTYTGNRDHTYMVSVIGKGTIVRTEKGIFVKSNDKVKKAHEENVRGRKSTIWVYREEYDYAKVNFIKEL